VTTTLPATVGSGERRLTAANGSAITIRPLLSNEDCRAAVDLQREIWGFEVGDIVPASLLHVVSFVGGLAAGAFDEKGTLLGVAFGVTGFRDGVLAHWSHMLGVREQARNAGVGRMLKEYQRDMLAELGIARIYWTFDPLQAKNAYFNIQRLGVQIDEYVPDMYGDTGSPLHFGLPTDRLVVHIGTGPRAVGAQRRGTHTGIPILSACPREGDLLADRGARPPAVLIEIPADALAVATRAYDTARAWRLAVREQFQWALANGYSATAMHRDSATARCFYVMTRA
jgi:predicted GNAT superfamily acetyltransferase